MAVVDDVVFSISCSGPAVGLFTPAKTGINCQAVTAGTLAAIQTKIAALASAINSLTLGVLNSDSITISTQVSAGGPSGVANRSQKWIISAQESTGDLNKFTYTIPAGDPAIAITGTNAYDPANGAWTAFKTAFEAVAESPSGSPLNFIGAKLGGRRR